MRSSLLVACVLSGSACDDNPAVPPPTRISPTDAPAAASRPVVSAPTPSSPPLTEVATDAGTAPDFREDRARIDNGVFMPEPRHGIRSIQVIEGVGVDGGR